MKCVLCNEEWDIKDGGLTVLSLPNFGLWIPQGKVDNCPSCSDWEGSTKWIYKK